MKGHIAAQIARDAATEQSDLYITLSGQMCWDAVMTTHKRAGVAASDKPIYGEDCAHVISLNDPAVASKSEMQKVPQGAFVGFFRDGTLVHAMIATGAGIAAGNKNECIGVGAPLGWELLNLAETLSWQAGGFVDPGNRLHQVRYRAVV